MCSIKVIFVSNRKYENTSKRCSLLKNWMSTFAYFAFVVKLTVYVEIYIQNVLKTFRL